MLISILWSLWAEACQVEENYGSCGDEHVQTPRVELQSCWGAMAWNDNHVYLNRDPVSQPTPATWVYLKIGIPRCSCFWPSLCSNVFDHHQAIFSRPGSPWRKRAHVEWACFVPICTYNLICMYVCMHACTYVSIYLCMYVPMYVSMHLSVYLCIYLCIYVSMYLCIYVCMHAYMYACMLAWINVCMHAWM